MKDEKLIRAIRDLLRDAHVDEHCDAVLYDADARAARNRATVKRAQAVALYKILPSSVKGRGRVHSESQLQEWARDPKRIGGTRLDQTASNVIVGIIGIVNFLSTSHCKLAEN